MNAKQARNNVITLLQPLVTNQDVKAVAVHAGEIFKANEKAVKSPAIFVQYQRTIYQNAGQHHTTREYEIHCLILVRTAKSKGDREDTALDILEKVEEILEASAKDLQDAESLFDDGNITILRVVGTWLE